MTTPPVTERQLQIIRLLASGYGYKQIADLLGISPATVRNHLHVAYESLGANHSAHAVALAWDWLNLSQ